MTKTLERQLSFKDSFALVVGSIIGTGVFLKTATMTQLVGNLQWVLLAWLAAGVMSYLGALIYAELGSRYPQAGGEYAFLRASYGDRIAFLYGWARFLIASPASIAAYAVGSATFASGFLDIQSAGLRTAFAVGAIAFFTWINCTRVQNGGLVQVVLTWLKMTLILGLSAMILTRNGVTPADAAASAGAFPGWQNFGAAVLAALWAFDGWNNLPMAAGEVKNPSRTLPLAMLLGVTACFLIYAISNFSYFVALPVAEIVSSNSRQFSDALPVATNAAVRVLGGMAVPLLSIGFVISALGAMNGSILTAARVPYAMARDQLFFRGLGELGGSSHVPVAAVLLQGTWSAALALTGSFDLLTDYVVFSSWIFYGLCGYSIILLRRKGPPAEGFRAPFYPILPVIFIVMTVALLVNTIVTMPLDSAIGIGIIALGLPVYEIFRRRQDPGMKAPEPLIAK